MENEQAAATPLGNVSFCGRGSFIGSGVSASIAPATRKDKEEEASDQLDYSLAVKELVALALPSMVTFFMVFLLSGLTFAATGRLLGTADVALVSVAFFFVSIVALYPLAGLAFAVDTVCAQEFGRDRNSTRQGEVTQQSIVVATALLVPISVALRHTEPLLQRWYAPSVAEAAALWIAQMPWFLVPTIYSTTLAKFLCNQYKPHLPSIALTVAVVSLPFTEYLFVKRCGFVGSAYGLAAAAWIQLLVMLGLMRRDVDACTRWGTWSWARVLSPEPMMLFFKLGLPSVVFVVSESAAFDVTALLAALLSETDAAAWTVMLSVFLTLDCVCSGFSIAACAAVGSALGANKPGKAILLAKVAVLLTAVIALVNGTLLFWFHRTIYSLYTSDERVLDATSSVAWLIIPFHVCDSVQFVFQGVFSGAGMNHLGAGALLVSLWVVGVGSIWTMLQWGYGLVSVPLGLATGLATCCPILAVLCFFRFDWVAIAQAAADELQNSGVSTNTSTWEGGEDEEPPQHEGTVLVVKTAADYGTNTTQ